MRQRDAQAKTIRPLARIMSHATHSHEPEWFTTAPVGAIKKVLEKAGWQTADVDLYEVNEAFATVTMAAMKELDLPHDKVNVNGGACALGTPLVAIGSRIMCTFINATITRSDRSGAV